MATEGTGSANDDRGAGIWNLLPSFDPSTDNAREYIAKVRFLDGICPKKDRPMLAPRLAMLCKGTAWHQVRALSPSLLTDPTNGVKHFLVALQTWEESAELKTFELFERAIYKTIQKADETTQSYVNRLMVAFDEVGPDTTLKSVMAFVLLKQSSLNHEDKKKVLTITNGVLEKTAIEGAMRSLSTNVLTGQGSVEKKKVYPTNFIETEENEPSRDSGSGQAYVLQQEEDEELTQDAIDSLASWGDADALAVQTFEKDLEDLFQDVPDLHTALISYHEARPRISERKRNRGFWPPGQKSSGKGYKSSFNGAGGRGFRKGGSKGKDELLQRIARTHCKRCGELGHWKAECPNKPKDQVNIVTQEADEETDQVVFETLMEDDQMEVRLEEKHSNIQMSCQSSTHEHACAFVGIQTASNSLDPDGKIKIKMQQFFANRSKSVHFARHHFEPKILPNPVSTFPSCTSKAGHEAFDTKGFAIVDTGASRSVIGSENLPQMMQMLDSTTRARVKEKSSCIGFRFGNNQIEYSFKQIWIPIYSDTQQIWIIIEVVPKCTPFLLSIQTMRKLGAVLDLQKGTCYLQTLNRAIPLKQGNTGLLMISLADLCKKSFLPAFVASKSVEHSASDQGESHANQARCHEHDQGHRRSGDAIAQDSLDTADESSPNPGGRTGRADGSERACATDPEPDAGGSEPEDHVTGNSQEPSTFSSNTRLSWPSSHRMDRHRGEGDPHLGGRNADVERESQNDIIQQPNQASGHSTNPYVSGAQKAQPSRTGWSKWSPIASDRDSITRWQPGPCRSCSDRTVGDAGRIQGTERTRPRLDSRCNERMGSQVGELGQKEHRPFILRHLRDRRGLCGLVSISSELTEHADSRFCQVRSGTKANGGTAPTGSLINLATQVSNATEVKWLRALRDELKESFHGSRIDLLEVYAQPNSRLAEEVVKQGGKAERFTREHGDLSTFAGQLELLRMVTRLRPKHVWAAPECAPWCSRNRFNALRSTQAFDRIDHAQEQSREHLKLCAFICKLQIEGGRHFTMENPGTSSMWFQPEVKEIIQFSKTAMFDQCQFGLKHPDSKDPLKKGTRLQTTSIEVLKTMDGRTCDKTHSHQPVAGSCQFKGKTIATSRFAAFYPRLFAKRVAKSILDEMQKPEFPIVEAAAIMETLCPVREAETNPEDEPDSKRKRVMGPVEDPRNRKRELEQYEQFSELTGQPWIDVLERLQVLLPKSGAQIIDLDTWPGKFIRQHCQIEDVQEIKAIKGVEKFMTGNPTCTHRQTISLCRKTQKIMDLGVEEWTKLTMAQQRRKAIPSHIMIGIFGRNSLNMDETQPKSESAYQPVRAEMSAEPKGEEEKSSSSIRKHPDAEHEMSGKSPEAGMPSAENPRAPIQAWSPATTVNSGPKFLELNSKQQAMIRKMHNNLGHPVADRLAEHLQRLGFTQGMVEGARDYHCQSCAERVPPKLTTPGKLKEPREFNERISMDGFEWKGEKGQKYYVLHFFDEATHFHLGRRCIRNGESTIKTFIETWTHWAGAPLEIQHDEAGEFVSQAWKDHLQQEGIRAIVSAAPWQRGRIERHGGVIKEMLSRIDKDKPIGNEKQFDMALNQCFQAKNSLTITKGFSPEQAVLGRSRKLPASICGDEDFTAHSLDNPADTRSEDFLQKLEVRTLARKALLDADNSQAIRRAINHQSRGQEYPWKCGELCMVWDKRKSPNMLEKGRWTGPCQVIMEESRTILWVTHMNRLLRVAKENIRPVSIREFNQVSTFHQNCDEKRLQEMANQLKNQLKERSGMFQFSDLTELEVEGVPEAEVEIGPQPEEEPIRRESNASAPASFAPPNTEDHDGTSEAIPQDAPAAGSTESGENDVGVNEHPPGLGESSQEFVGNSVELIYNASIVEANDPEALTVKDNGTLWPQTEDISIADANFCMFEFEVPCHVLSAFCESPCLHADRIAQAAKKNHVEIQYRNLNQAEKAEFDQAKSKELGCWVETSSIEPILKDRIHPSRIMSSRWILTWKLDPTHPQGRKAKARLVVRGFEDPDAASVCTESPTLSRDGRMVILQEISSRKWTLQSFDIKTAFLRGRSDHRTLAMQPVPELQKLLNLQANEVCLLKGNAYGRVDAPILFYKEFRKTLEAEGFEAHPLDACLFVLRNKQDPTKLEGILGTHVDDGIGGGTTTFDKALERIQKHLPFGQREYKKFRFTGLDMEQNPDYSIRVSQSEYLQKIDPIDIPKPRRKDEQSSITPAELQQLRALCGSLQYAAVHSRPDIAAKVAFLQKKIPKAMVSDLMEANKVLREAKTTSETSILVQPIPLQEVTFASFGDASFASENQLRAQQGLFIMATTERLGRNEVS